MPGTSVLKVMVLVPTIRLAVPVGVGDVLRIYTYWSTPVVVLQVKVAVVSQMPLAVSACMVSHGKVLKATFDQAERPLLQLVRTCA